MTDTDLTGHVLAYAREHLGTEPSYLWPDKHPSFGVLRHSSGRWFGMIMRLDYEKVGVDKHGECGVLNVKANPELIDALVTRTGFSRGYHMNKTHWVSVRLDGSVELDDVWDLLHDSFRLTGGKS